MQWSVLLPVVLTLVATHEHDKSLVDRISDLCYAKWALEAFVVSNAKRFVVCIISRDEHFDVLRWSFH